MGNKTNNRILWHGNGLDSDGKAQGPPIATSADGLNGLNEGEVYINNADADPAIFIRTDAGNVVRVGGGGGGGADYTREEINNLLKKKVDTAFFAKLFGLMGADGGEISVNDVDTEASSLQSRLGLWTEKWISVKGANPDAGGGGGGGGGDGTLAGLTDVSLGALQDGQSLVWSASAQKWVNRTVDAGLDEAALSQYLTSNHYATESYVDGKLDGKVDAVFFAKLLAAIAGDGSEIAVNDMETAIASIKVKFGLWSESYVSVKGDNPDAGGTPSGATSLSDLSDVSLGTLQSGQVLTWNGSKWVNKAVETGLDEAALGQYLLAHGYLTDTAAAGKYALRTVSITAGTGLTGGGDLSANVTLGLEAVGTAGTYVKVTVDAYGRVTGHGSLAAGDIPALSISKITGLQSALDGKLDASVFEDLFEKVSLEGGGYAIRAKYGLYSDDWVSVMGANPDAGGTSGGGATSLAELSDVSLGTLQDGQVLRYDAASGKWVNGTGLSSVSLGDITDLHASWDALLKAAPSAYVTRWPTAAEVGALTQGTADGRYVTINTDQTITGRKTFTNGLSFKYDVDTSRVYTINFNDTSNETMGSIGYLNVSKFFYINPIGSSDPWQDSVGKYNLIIGNNKLTYNTYPILHSANYTTYTVTKTGGGASGTWPINITGSAKILAQQDTRGTNTTPFAGGKGLHYHFKLNTTDGLNDGDTYHSVLQFNQWDEQSGGLCKQLALTDAGNMWFRNASSSTAWGAWKKLLDSSNYASILDGRYVNVSGDTMSGNLVVNATPVSMKGLVTFNNTAGGETYFYLQSAGTSYGAFTSNHPSYGTAIFDNTSSRYLGITAAGVPHFQGNKLWHAGNDGSGSGLDADLLDGYNASSFESYRLVTINASSLNQNTWYPVTMAIGDSLRTRIRIEGNTSANASWNTRSDKLMSLYLDYSTNGSMWGWTDVTRYVNAYYEGAGTSSCLRGLGQLTNTSTEYVYVRGGAVYNFYVSRFITPVLRTSTYTVENQSVSPTTTAPAAISRTNALITDNVYSATKLQTARTIWGQSFNGTANVSGNMTGVGSISASGTIGTTATTILAFNTYTNKSVLRFDWNTYSSDALFINIPGTNNQTVWMRLVANFGLRISGGVGATGGIYSNSYVSALGQNSSDARLKTNIQDFKATTLIKQLHPKSFEWNDLAKSKFEVFRNTGTQYGLIAQDVKEVMPEWVDDNLIGSGYMGIRYDKLIPVVLKGLLENMDRTESHEARIMRLEKENRRLVKRIKDLERRLKS